VREIFPETTIVRPPPLFGAEDRLLNPLAAPRLYFTSSPLTTPTFKPAYVFSFSAWFNIQVNDVALALEIMMHEPSTAAQTFDLSGPETFTRDDLMSIVFKYSHQKPRVIYLPRRIKALIAEFRNLFVYWYHPGWTPDEVTREHIDHVPSKTGPNGEKVLGWKDLAGMTDLEPLDGLIVKTQLRNFQRGMESTPVPKRKTEAERAREAEMNKIL